MKCNVGKLDRVIRIILGIVLILAGIFYKSWWGALGIIPIITAVIGWCPLYIPFKISTSKTEEPS